MEHLVSLRRAIRTALPLGIAFGLVAAVAALALGACASEGPAAAATGADTTLTLAIGAEVSPFGDLLHVSVVEVRNDSRCPADVECVWAGNAVVRVGLGVGTGPTTPYDLNTALDPRSVIYGTYRITLVALSPTPLSTTSIPVGDYRARLRVERFGPD